MYNDKIMDRFKNPIYVGEIKDADGIGEVGNVKCGDIMRVYIKVKKVDADGNKIENKDDQTIEDVRCKTYGCVAAIASSDTLCEMAIGRKLKDAAVIKAKDVVAEMGGDVPDSKFHCSILAHEALAEAIKNYKKE